MKVEIFYTSSFERDVKKMKKRRKDLSKLKTLSGILAEKKKIPTKYKNHKLSGNYRGYWECHIEPDWLLIYKKTTKMLVFERTGTHADLF